MDSRRTWHLRHTQVATFHARVEQAAALPLWGRLHRKKLRVFLARWRSRSAVLTSQREYKQLVRRHRTYLLRKIVLNTHWRCVSKAFTRWFRLCQCFTRLHGRMVKWHRMQMIWLAWQRWRRMVVTEKLEEEAAACLWVMRMRKVDQLAQRTKARADNDRLVAHWVTWKRWYRFHCCRAWRRGLCFAMHNYFYAWKKYHVMASHEKMVSKSIGQDAALWIIDSCIVHCGWEERRRTIHGTVLGRLFGILCKWEMRVHERQLVAYLKRWKSAITTAAAAAPVDATAEEPTPSPLSRQPTFPERFVLAYRLRHQRLDNNNDTEQKKLNSQIRSGRRMHWR